MSDSPFRERRVPPEEVQRILKRAAELALLDPAAEKLGEALTTAELEARLLALGISPEVARRAMEPPPPPHELPRAPDGAVRIERELQIDGMLSPDHFEEIAELINAAMKIPGRTSAVGNKLTWSPTGLGLEPSVTVHAKDGVTTIRYVETLAHRGQMAIGFGTLAALGGIMAGAVGSAVGVGIAKTLEISQASGAPVVLGVGVLLGVGTAVSSFFGLRRLVAHRAQTRAAFADELVARVGQAVTASLKQSPLKTRVDAGSNEARESEAFEAHAEAEARNAVIRNRP